MSKIVADVVVGAQFGGEGKGQVSLMMANLHDYDFAIRVGSQNERHAARDEGGAQFVTRILPMATYCNRPTIPAIGPGMRFSIGALAQELTGIAKRRVLLDEFARVIDQAGKPENGGLLAPPPEAIAGMYSEELSKLGVEMCRMPSLLRAFAADPARNGANTSVLIEPTHGSLYKDDPMDMVDNTATGALVAAGLSWHSARRVVMVVSANGLDFDRLQDSATINRPSSVVLTFIDAFDPMDAGKRTWRALSLTTKKLVKDVEETCLAPVAVVRTGPEYWDQIFTRRET